jgi:hypothetical protein
LIHISGAFLSLLYEVLKEQQRFAKQVDVCGWSWWKFLSIPAEPALEAANFLIHCERKKNFNYSQSNADLCTQSGAGMTSSRQKSADRLSLVVITIN